MMTSEHGMPYQTLNKLIVHEYVTNRLYEKDEVLWEIHEIRNEIHDEKSFSTLTEIHEESKRILETWKSRVSYSVRYSVAASEDPPLSPPRIPGPQQQAQNKPRKLVPGDLVVEYLHRKLLVVAHAVEDGVFDAFGKPVVREGELGDVESIIIQSINS
ncbi:MAG: hypothetical protein EA383_00790 [Spirochaetaceae bacterium]|nr:MAG: hypothetical protein EA383_00790 [Spirochaetaceae bacterium]